MYNGLLRLPKMAWSWFFLRNVVSRLTSRHIHWLNYHLINARVRWKQHSPSGKSSMHSNVISNWNGFPNGLGLSSTATFNTCTLAIPVTSEEPQLLKKMMEMNESPFSTSRSVAKLVQQWLSAKASLFCEAQHNSTTARLPDIRHRFLLRRWPLTAVSVLLHYCHLVEKVRHYKCNKPQTLRGILLMVSSKVIDFCKV